MSETQVTLCLDTALLALGSLGSAVVRRSNPLLRGMGWVAAFLGVHSIGVFFLFRSSQLRSAGAACVALLLILLSTVILQAGALALFQSPRRFPQLGAGLLVVLAAVESFMFLTRQPPQFITSAACLAIGIQYFQMASFLLVEARGTLRFSARFTAAVLFLCALQCFGEGTAWAAGVLHQINIYEHTEMVLNILFAAMTLGIAFGFFWMMTSLLSDNLETMASTDPLTRLYNRRTFLLWCEREQARSDRLGRPFSILMIDLDHFKHINDSYGHQAGDMAICSAVEKMQDSIRGIDVLARWGGEEFAALLPNARPDAAMIVAERARANIEKVLLQATTIASGAHGIQRLTASIGVATYQGGGDIIENVIQRADRGLYAAKTAGRNRVVAAPHSSSEIEAPTTLETSA